jgi:hypothetical protein
MLSGCDDMEYCGIFRQVAAHCVRGGHCPGGANARPGWTDATLCDAAPVYQREVGGQPDDQWLFRYMDSDGSTEWIVTDDSSILTRCRLGDHAFLYHSVVSASLASSPDAAIYGWSTPGGYESEYDDYSIDGYGYGDGTVHIVMGDDGDGGDGMGDGGGGH